MPTETLNEPWRFPNVSVFHVCLYHTLFWMHLFLLPAHIWSDKSAFSCVFESHMVSIWNSCGWFLHHFCVSDWMFVCVCVCGKTCKLRICKSQFSDFIIHFCYGGFDCVNLDSPNGWFMRFSVRVTLIVSLIFVCSCPLRDLYKMFCSVIHTCSMTATHRVPLSQWCLTFCSLCTEHHPWYYHIGKKTKTKQHSRDETPAVSTGTKNIL